MTSTRGLCLTCVLLSSAALNRTASPPEIKWVSIPRSKLCITDGAIGEDAGHRLTVDVAKMRAIARDPTSDDVEANFTYNGGSATETPLASGAMRRQFGFKLRGLDPCNLIYAMWRIEPKEALVVSVKSNPGQHTSAECGNRGYTDIKPAHTSPLPPIPAGSTHKLRAEMTGADLRVYADDRLVWQGDVGSLATSFAGPVGIRSDNVKLAFDFRAGQSAGALSNSELGCKSDPNESE